MLNPIFMLMLLITKLIFWLVIISVIMSWLVAFGVMNLRNPLMRNIYESIERIMTPLYRPIRKYIPTNFGGIDIAPIILLIGIQFVEYTIFYIHHQL